MRHLVRSRRCILIATTAQAIETSERAKVQRQRYDDGALFESFEKPFLWTDPAVVSAPIPDGGSGTPYPVCSLC